ncbi:DUF6801 domain-containing protein [Solicola gregarius]|uniref:DUF6801 domain-containing protein n=1 Tax=Solicola gregarius TaxID=2908642 RepID=A0AA46THA1_9ACTN|nr:DUF6801 domain-containing protein [Solicola gregarius]UYM05332.1 hypothetical protein L0C25_22940 [Solicola gregarius]
MQTDSRSARTKRVSAGVAVVSALALTGGALGAGPVNAQNASTDSARTTTISKKGVKYKCKATNSVVDQIVGGPQQFLIDGKLVFKGKFKPGTKIRSGAQRLTLVLPKKLVRKVRKDLKVKRVKGSAKMSWDFKAKPGGVTKVPVKGLRSPWRKVPKKGTMRIPVKGTAGSYKIKKGTKNVKLYAPKRFLIHARLAPPVLGSVKKTDLRCKFNGKSRKLGTLMK